MTNTISVLYKERFDMYKSLDKDTLIKMIIQLNDTIHELSSKINLYEANNIRKQ